MMVSLDLETGLIQPGYPAPKLVCGALATEDQGDTLLTPEEARATFVNIHRTGVNVCGANIAYDFGVLAVDALERGSGHGFYILSMIFDLYDRGQVFDVQIAQALDAIARGCLFKDPRSGGPLRKASGEVSNRYSLEICTQLTLGRMDAKANDFWRLRYAMLADTPFDLWPEQARQYPIDDVRNGLDIALAMLGKGKSFEHDWRIVEGTTDVVCGQCGKSVTMGGEATCPNGKPREPYKNLHCLPDESYTAWCLWLASMWGLRTDPVAVAKIESDALEAQRKAIERFKAVGYLRTQGDGPKIKDGSKDTARVKHAVAEAYGASGTCPTCAGSGKVPSPKSGNPIQCKVCDATGFDLGTAPGLPRTETGLISCDRDTLMESGNDELSDFGEIESKTLGTYVPYLKTGLHWPINNRPNVLVDSGRTSYDGVIQLIPREGPLREAFIPRASYYFLSTDYSAQELCTLAQCALWIVGRSRMAEVINQTGNPGQLHTAFAAKMIGTTTEDLALRIKAGGADGTQAKAYRQAAKAANFGFPGGMGAAKLVLSKRKRSEGTTKSITGQVYAGIRFCVLIEGAEVCGLEKVTMWRDRPYPPTCKRCIEIVENLKRDWLSYFDEMPEYFRFISRHVDSSGELTQFGDNMVRGGLDFNNGANTLFQHLGAVISKRALRKVSKESYTDRQSPLFGTRVVAFQHDELFSETPCDVAHHAGPRQATIMVEAAKEVAPDITFVVEPALMCRWYKAAEPVYQDGKLIPWEPKK